MIIFKHQFSLHGDTMKFEWPEDSKVIHVAVKDGAAFLWVQHRIDPQLSNHRVTREFEIIGTGQNFNGALKRHVGTFFDGPFVWHLYENILRPSPSILR